MPSARCPCSTWVLQPSRRGGEEQRWVLPAAFLPAGTLGNLTKVLVLWRCCHHPCAGLEMQCTPLGRISPDLLRAWKGSGLLGAGLAPSADVNIHLRKITKNPNMG